MTIQQKNNHRQQLQGVVENDKILVGRDKNSENIVISRTIDYGEDIRHKSHNVSDQRKNGQVLRYKNALKTIQHDSSTQ